MKKILINKKADFTFAKITGFLLLLILLAWIIFWYGGLRESIISMLNSLF